MAKSKARLFVAPKHRERLARYGLREAGDFLHPSAEHAVCLRDLGRRANFKLTLGGRVFYLKRVKCGRSLKRWLGLESSNPEALQEWHAAVALAKAEIPALTPVAAGARGDESFFMSEDIRGALQGDEFLRRTPLPFHDKKRFAAQLADLARLFHAAGFCHKDFYLCHVFARRKSVGGFDLRLIDLQRVEKFRSLPERWRVKDLAALHYSSLEIPVTHTGRLRFFLRYTGVERLGKPERALLRKIVAKSARIARHDAKARARRPLPVIRDAREAT